MRQKAYGSHPFAGGETANSTVSITAVIGASNPTPLIEGPLVSGSINSNPSVGTVVTFTNRSYDPDDALTTASLICSSAWTLHWPDSSTSTGSNKSSFGATLSQAGTYTLDLTVTDNEGQQSTTSLTFDVGPTRQCTPHIKPPRIGTCSDDKFSIDLDPNCGNGSANSHDPTATRGSPLKNEIRINSRKNSVTPRSFMGNGTFTYGTQVVIVNEIIYWTTAGAVTAPHRYVVDGLGYVYDYGFVGGGSSSSTKGVFPTLTENTSGFTLSGAGNPEEIYRAGNFTYSFDSTGRLQTITDPNGNVQTVSYDTSLNPTTVTDSSSGKTISFDYGTNGEISTVTENGGFAYRAIGYDSSNRITSITTKNNSNVAVRSIAITYDSSSRIGTVTRDGNSATTATYTYQSDVPPLN